MKETIVVGASIAQRPRNGGHTWALLQYVLGFRRLGWDVLLIDRLEPDMCHDEAGRPCSLERSANLSYYEAVVRHFELEGQHALFSEGQATSGLPRSEMIDRVRRSALLLNVMGFVTDEEILGAAGLRVFLDIDPGFGQMWCELGLADIFAGHDRYFTVGENVGQASCTIPDCGLVWEVTAQPVILERWPYSAEPGTTFTTVATWRGPYAPVEYHGTTYGLRVHEFRRFAELPTLTRAKLEVALDIDDADSKDVELLARNGWARADPGDVAADPDAYQRYIVGSRGEFSVAKGMYVQTRSGWFSDRSICYLAAGRPVIAQETGFSDNYPVGAGLLAFETVDEALAAVDEVQGAWEPHSKAARDLAESFFDSDRVLERLLSRVGIA